MGRVAIGALLVIVALFVTVLPAPAQGFEETVEALKVMLATKDSRHIRGNDAINQELTITTGTLTLEYEGKFGSFERTFYSRDIEFGSFKYSVDTAKLALNAVNVKRWPTDNKGYAVWLVCRVSECVRRQTYVDLRASWGDGTTVSEMPIFFEDELTAERAAKALNNLLRLSGAKPSAF